MEQVEVTGKTVDEAIEKGLKELGITKKQAEIEVTNEPSEGLLGIIGSKPARVKVIKKFDPAYLARDYLEGLLDKMKIPTTVAVQNEQEDEIFLDIQGKNLGVVIGKRGQTLDALQLLVNLYINQQMRGCDRFVILDAENYREKRKKTLERLAHNLAEKVMRTRKKVILEPMNRYERKVIHTSLQEKSNITTYSEGTEPHRKVVIDLEQ